MCYICIYTNRIHEVFGSLACRGWDVCTTVANRESFRGFFLEPSTLKLRIFNLDFASCIVRVEQTGLVTSEPSRACHASEPSSNSTIVT